MLSSTFDSTQVTRLFAAQAIAGSKIANGDITGTQLATSVAGSGLTGGGGSALAVEPNVTDNGQVPGLEAAANGVRIAAAAAGNGLAGGGGTALSVDVDSETGSNIQPANLTANGVGVDINAIAGTGVEADGSANLRLATQGNGIAGGNGSTLSVDPDSESGGNTEPVSVGANGVGLNVSGIAGTGIEADGSANLRLAAQGNGITGGAGSTLSVDPDTGIAVGASGVAVDVGSTVDFSGDTPVWTFGNETTAEGLFVTGTPQDANHVPNKSYVDNAITGLTWLPPVHVKEMIGSDAALDIEGFSPAAGDAYVIDTANGAGVLAGATVGDIWEYSGSAWALIIAGDGGYVANGYRALASIQTALNGSIGLVNDTDDGKVLEWDGTSLTPAKTSPSSGDAALITDQDADGDSIYANSAFTFEGAVPTGTWIQFSGAGSINAGAGLSKDGNTINVGDANKGVQANADDLEIAASEIVSNGLGVGASSHLLAVKPNTADNGGVPGVEVAANGLRLAAAAAGDGLAGGAGDALSVDSDTETGGNIQGVNVTANGAGLDVSAVAGTGVEADGSANLRLATQGNGIAGGNGSTLSVDSDTETGGNVQGANVTANGVGVDINAIAGTGLEADGSANLRLATQGNGISGGNGSTLSVDPDTGIAVGASGVAIDVGSTVDFSGDTPVWTFGNETTAEGLFVTGTPQDANHVPNKSYVDTAVGNVNTAALTASDKARIPSSATSGNYSTTGLTISATPLGWVGIYVNGILYELGADRTKACYFSSDGGTTAKAIAAIASGDTLYWNGSIIGWELDDSTDVVDMVYET